MYRQIQLRGERDWAGDDLIALQAEPLKAIDAFFSRYPACVLSGCEVSANGARFDVAPGYVALKGSDHEGKDTTMIVPFEGVRDTVLPLYLTLTYEAVTDVYGDGEMKPIAYNYKAIASVQPSVEAMDLGLKITELDTPTYEQVITESTRQYFIKKLDELIANAPGALDTLKELADALGGDPNFSTTVLQKISEKLDPTTEAVSPLVFTEENRENIRRLAVVDHTTESFGQGFLLPGEYDFMLLPGKEYRRCAVRAYTQRGETEVFLDPTTQLPSVYVGSIPAGREIIAVEGRVMLDYSSSPFSCFHIDVLSDANSVESNRHRVFIRGLPSKYVGQKVPYVCIKKYLYY